MLRGYRVDRRVRILQKNVNRNKYLLKQSKDHSKCLSIPFTCKSLQGEYLPVSIGDFFRLIAYINLLPVKFSSDSLHTFKYERKVTENRGL